MRYPASFIEQVKSHFRLSEIIGRRVDLRRHGREYTACCPFHSEKTPSFTVNDEKGFYHCFGCAAHGDVIVFLMEYERLNYKEAIESLAREAGIALPRPDPVMAVQVDREERLLKLMEDARRWFCTQLYGSVGHAARNYLRDRDIHERTIQNFDIGYAPQSREGLKIAMQQLGYTESQLIETGLLIQVEGRASYDRFRGRVMFPIRRIDGKVIAFGGRLLEKSETSPKYLNSPETLLFKKHEILFNLHEVRKSAHNAPYIVVVEGYIDVISMHTGGIIHAVAPLGTAFGESHLQQLWRYHPNPIICFDGDKAGQKAMLRAAEMALPHVKAGQLVRFCGLPNGEDPDSFMRSSGSASMEHMLQRSLSLSELLWNLYIGNREFTAPEELAVAEHQLMQAIERIKDSALKHRIAASYRNRLWHVAKRVNAPVAGKKTSGPKTSQGMLSVAADAPLSEKAKENMLKHMHKQDGSLLEQVFALLVRFPALLKDGEVEQVVYEWDWSATSYHACLADSIARIEQVSSCRYVFLEYLAREFPGIDARLQQLYAEGIIPAQLYGLEEDEGMEEARAMFRRLKQRYEQRAMRMELEQRLKNQRSETDDAATYQLMELIKMQQKAHALNAQHVDDSYS